jgi:hypothetical protein
MFCFPSLALSLLFWQWRPIPAVVWQIADPQIAMAAVALSFFGWLLVLTSTFLINHFEVDPVWWTVCRLGRLGFREHLRLVSDWG